MFKLQKVDKYSRNQHEVFMQSMTFSCSIYRCSKPIFCSIVAQKGKSYSRLLEPQNVAPRPKDAQKLPNTIGTGLPQKLFVK